MARDPLGLGNACMLRCVMSRKIAPGSHEGLGLLRGEERGARRAVDPAKRRADDVRQIGVYRLGGYGQLAGTHGMLRPRRRGCRRLRHSRRAGQRRRPEQFGQRPQRHPQRAQAACSAADSGAAVHFEHHRLEQPRRAPARLVPRFAAIAFQRDPKGSRRSASRRVQVEPSRNPSRDQRPGQSARSTRQKHLQGVLKERLTSRGNHGYCLRRRGAALAAAATSSASSRQRRISIASTG
jgi:hypothetical protein